LLIIAISTESPSPFKITETMKSLGARHFQRMFNQLVADFFPLHHPQTGYFPRKIFHRNWLKRKNISGNLTHIDY